MQSRLTVLSALALVAAITALPALAVQRTFVASYGNDANTATNCGFANPCRGFTAAQTATDSGGEIVALDAAGYGAVTITKSITITANPGFYAGISAASGNAVTIATAGVVVVLRGLNMNGIGASNGVSMSNGARLTIENCLISNFSNHGVVVLTQAAVRMVATTVQANGGTGLLLDGGATATISGSTFLDNVDRGIMALVQTVGVTSAAVSDTTVTGSFVAIQAAGQVSGASAIISVTRSTLSNNGFGPAAGTQSGATAVLTISDSMVTRNVSAGIYQNGAGATVESLGNNNMRQNGANTGTLTTVSPS
jgi:hypothetical protein